MFGSWGRGRVLVLLTSGVAAASTSSSSSSSSSTHPCSSRIASAQLGASTASDVHSLARRLSVHPPGALTPSEIRHGQTDRAGLMMVDTHLEKLAKKSHDVMSPGSPEAADFQALLVQHGCRAWLACVCVEWHGSPSVIWCCELAGHRGYSGANGERCESTVPGGHAPGARNRALLAATGGRQWPGRH